MQNQKEEHHFLLLVVLDGLIGCNSCLINRHRQDVEVGMLFDLLDMVMLIY